TYQELSRFELGVNGGISRTSVPKGPLYTGESTFWNGFGGVRALYTIKEYFQVGLEVNGQKWESTANNVPLTGLQGKPLGTDTVRYVYARPAVSFLFQANGMIPLFRKYRFENVANIHM